MSEGNIRKYHYNYQIKAIDLWQMSMYYTYSSYLAMINIICIVSSFVLIISLWETSGPIFKTILILFVSLFLVIQPLGAYLRALKSLKGNNDTIDLTFDEDGLRVQVNDKVERKSWKELLVTVKPTLVAVYVSRTNGYVLTNRILKDSRKDFISFFKERQRIIAENNNLKK